MTARESRAARVREYVKVKGEEHPADGLTNHVKQELAEKVPKDHRAEARQGSS